MELKHALEENGIARGPLLNTNTDTKDVSKLSCSAACFQALNECHNDKIWYAAPTTLQTSLAKHRDATEFCYIASIARDAGYSRSRCRTA